MKRQLLVAAALAAALAAASAFAAPRIESVSAKPNPAPFEAGKTASVVIAVTIERPTPLDQACEATIDPGDGSRALAMSWEFGDRRTKTTLHEYTKPGNYRLKVSGSGKDACVGAREVTVAVGAHAAPPAAKAAKSAAAEPSCPPGWALVKSSVKGARFACRPQPPAEPLACAQGTKYFAARGEIGCR